MCSINLIRIWKRQRMGYDIIFSMTAEQDLRDIAFNILDVSKSLNIAKAFTAKLRESVDRLSEFPDSGLIPKSRYLINMGYRYIVEGDYLVFYKKNEEKNTIEITSVQNGKQNYVRIIKSRLL